MENRNDLVRKLQLKQEKKPKTKPMKKKPKIKPIKDGHVVNPITGRQIKINGRTYRKVFPLQYIKNETMEKSKEIDKQTVLINEKYSKLVTKKQR